MRAGPPQRWMFMTVAGFALLGVRLFFAQVTELLPEEAYYWTYAQHSALSYYDHPPMVAWVITLGTTGLGDTELGVRLGTMVLSLGSFWLVFLLGRIWFDDRVARWAAFLFLMLPIYIGTGFLAFPDGPLIFFWLLTLWAISKAVLTNGLPVLSGAPRGRRVPMLYWSLAGLAFGGAMLSKYTAVLLAPSLLLFLLLSPRHRVWLRRPEPWLALVVALVLFSPVIVWNAQHQWASFVFHSWRVARPNPQVWKDVRMFWLLQLVALTPWLFVLFVCAAFRAIKHVWRECDEKSLFALSFSAPLFLEFVWASFRTAIRLNWTAPAFLSFLPAAAALVVDQLSGPAASARRWRLAAGVAASAAVVILGALHANLAWGLPKRFAHKQAGGWRELAVQVERAEAELARRAGQRPFVLSADRHYTASELSFYTGEPEEQVNVFAFGELGMAFRYWTDLERLRGRPALAVMRDTSEDTRLKLQAHLEKVEPPQQLAVPLRDGRTRTVYLAVCYGYRPDKTNSRPPVNQPREDR